MLTILNKADITDVVVSHNGFTNKQAQEILGTLIGIIKSTLVSGEDVLITGFGKFCVKDKAARQGRNPATGQQMTLSARRVVTFKCSGTLRERVNGR